MSTWFSASAVIPQLREAWDLSPSAAAWLTIAVQLGFVSGALVSSLLNLSDIVSPKHVILGGALGAALANLLLQVAGGPTVGIPLRFATGFFLAGVYPPAFKLMSTWFRAGRGLALGVLAAAIVVGNGMPHLVNGLGGLVLLVALIWGFAVVADSAQFSTMVTELADQAYVGTALTLQLALGFTIMVATIWLIPFLEVAFGWRWAFAFLAPGPALGVLAMLRLKSLPEAIRIGGGKG